MANFSVTGVGGLQEPGQTWPDLPFMNASIHLGGFELSGRKALIIAGILTSAAAVGGIWTWKHHQQVKRQNDFLQKICGPELSLKDLEKLRTGFGNKLDSFMTFFESHHADPLFDSSRKNLQGQIKQRCDELLGRSPAPVRDAESAARALSPRGIKSLQFAPDWGKIALVVCLDVLVFLGVPMRLTPPSSPASILPFEIMPSIEGEGIPQS